MISIFCRQAKVSEYNKINVKKIAKLVIDAMNLKNVVLQFTGGINGGRGWRGDVKKMLLDVTKLESLGWKNMYHSTDAIRQTIRALLK